jgi:hypothetical protein
MPHSKRIRIARLKVRREPLWCEVTPLDPRDRDVLRAKSLRRSQRGKTA